MEEQPLRPHAEKPSPLQSKDPATLRAQAAQFLSSKEHSRLLNNVRDAISSMTSRGTQLDSLQQVARQLQPLQLRQGKPGEGAQGKGAHLTAKAISPFTSSEIAIQQGDELIVLDSSNQDLWKVTSQKVIIFYKNSKRLPGNRKNCHREMLFPQYIQSEKYKGVL